ncbi:AI-2E family transporter [candidate division WWE3 bacterium]|uniref:AI-2E family transporter n=1 Tax=candidate division WWE3 bacterium TaxID=2053526 RepID=A0A955RP68_UNCKA|nr:AI-2E family transporter [candidate division WWE3 bacterium]MCA9397626.1 AI-2E family transporter [candidate division WWE3 bacterium]
MKPISITARSVLTVVAVLAGIWFLFAIRDILALLFIAIIIASALNPLVDFFEKFSAPRWFVIICLYIIIFTLLGVLLLGGVPLVYLQLQEFVLSLPEVFAESLHSLNLSEFLTGIQIKDYLPEIFRTFSGQIISTPVSVLKLAASVFGGLLDVFTLIVFSYYLLLERNKVINYVSLVAPEASRERVAEFVEKGEKKLGAWLRGQLTLMFIIGLFSFIGLSILNIRFAASLAIIAGLLEIVPLIGPVVATIPAVMVALTQSPLHAVAIVALYIFIQQLEQYLVVPHVMKSAVGLDPLIVILAIMVGSRISGTAGALLAIPVSVILLILWQEYKRSSVYPTSKE